MKMLNAKQVAEILSCSGTTIRNLAAKNALGFRAIRIGSQWRFPEEDVMAFVGAQTAVEKNCEDTRNDNGSSGEIHTRAEEH